MALDATVGGASASSYLTVAEADAFADVELGPYAKQWMLADLGDKERALISASSQIDAFVPRMPRWDVVQARAFPRLVDLDGFAVPFLLTDVRRAAYLQAAYLLSNADKLDQAASRRARGLISFSESDVSGAPSLDPSFGRLHPDVESLLGRFRTSATLRSVRVRSSYAP